MGYTGYNRRRDRQRPELTVSKDIKVIDSLFDGKYIREIIRDRTMDLITKKDHGPHLKQDTSGKTSE
jgi:hypothetical protein